MRPAHPARLLSLALLCLAGCATRSLDRAEWLRIETPHFEVVSALGRAETIALARDAELFRATVEFTLGSAIANPGVPTRIYAFDDRRPSRPFAHRAESGYFLPTLRQDWIVLRTGDGWGDDATLELRREYVQYLLRSQGPTLPPLWFDEGAAEFLGTARIDGDRVHLGLFDPGRVKLLRGQTWTPLLRILEATDLESWSPGDRETFAAESWLFVHYLNFGLESGQGRKGLGVYLEQTSQGVPPEVAVRAAFGKTSGELDRRLQDALKQERLASVVVRPTAFEPGDPSPVAIEEVLVGLGELSLALGRGEQAAEWFEKAIARDHRNPRANAGLGVALALGGAGSRASEQAGVAVSLDAQDPRNHLDAATVALVRARETKLLAPRAELAETARGHAAAASQLDARLAEAYASYGASYLLPGEEPSKAQESLDYAHQLLPASQEVLLLLARMHARMGHSTQARDLVVSVLARSHTRAIQRQAEQVLGVIDGTIAHRTILKGPGAETSKR
ncbi:MAG TPA: hypothetical protein VFC77_09155 [Myxococcota bacterium]|nr:hypothetical protein [Myxococcota bacterium]